MVDQVSALKSHFVVGHSGVAGKSAVMLEEIHDFSLMQIAAWPENLADVGQVLAIATKAERAPRPNTAIVGQAATLLRTEPLKYWIVNQNAHLDLPNISEDDGSVLDITHSRTWIRVTGDQAVGFLNHFLPLDLRDGAFPVGCLASSAIHHVGVSLWHSEEGYNLFIPRGFVVSIWEILCDTAQQYGLEVK